MLSVQPRPPGRTVHGELGSPEQMHPCCAVPAVAALMPVPAPARTGPYFIFLRIIHLFRILVEPGDPARTSPDGCRRSPLGPPRRVSRDSWGPRDLRAPASLRRRRGSGHQRLLTGGTTR